MIWIDKNGNILRNNGVYSFSEDDNLSIEIIDDTEGAITNVIVSEGSSIIDEYNIYGGNVNHRISGEKGKRYKLTIDYYDRFENNYKEVIYYTVN